MKVHLICLFFYLFISFFLSFFLSSSSSSVPLDAHLIELRFPPAGPAAWPAVCFIHSVKRSHLFLVSLTHSPSHAILCMYSLFTLTSISWIFNLAQMSIFTFLLTFAPLLHRSMTRMASRSTDSSTSLSIQPAFAFLSLFFPLDEITCHQELNSIDKCFKCQTQTHTCTLWSGGWRSLLVPMHEQCKAITSLFNQVKLLWSIFEHFATFHLLFSSLLFSSLPNGRLLPRSGWKLTG